jgi:hypothetical protein
VHDGRWPEDDTPASRCHDDGLAHLGDELHQRQIDVLHEVLARGVREGSMPPDYAVDAVSGQLIGPMFFAVVTGSQTVDEAFCDRVVDRFLRAFAP